MKWIICEVPVEIYFQQISVFIYVLEKLFGSFFQKTICTPTINVDLVVIKAQSAK